MQIMRFWIIILILLMTLVGCTRWDTSSAGKIEREGNKASGVFVSDGFLTSNHFLESWNKSDPIYVETLYNETVELKSLLNQGKKFTGKHDWAFFDVDVPENILQPKVYCSDVKLDQRVLHVGYPATKNYSVRVEEWGRIISLDVEDSLVGLTDGSFKGMIMISLGISSGNSGGPVYDESGRLIGIIIAYLRYNHGRSTHALMIRVPEFLCET